MTAFCFRAMIEIFRALGFAEERATEAAFLLLCLSWITAIWGVIEASTPE